MSKNNELQIQYFESANNISRSFEHIDRHVVHVLFEEALWNEDIFELYNKAFSGWCHNSVVSSRIKACNISITVDFVFTCVEVIKRIHAIKNNLFNEKVFHPSIKEKNIVNLFNSLDKSSRLSLFKELHYSFNQNQKTSFHENQTISSIVNYVLNQNEIQQKHFGYIVSCY